MKKQIQKIVLFALAMALSQTPVIAQAAEFPALLIPQEKVLITRLSDGVNLKVHYTEEALQKAGENSAFAQEVLDSAVLGYRTIVKRGFFTTGYTFAEPNKDFAYDPDHTIDVFLGDPEGEDAFLSYGIGRMAFQEAPCFDTVQVGQKAFQAMLLIPTNYRSYIENWGSLNPSPLGARDVAVDLHGTLTHELVHAMLFYYNRNLNPEASEEKRHVDWYVEGLARYFETFVGAQHDFYSQGFRQVLSNKIRFSRGGSNYFMRYPDQAFTTLRYENAIFWRFIDYKYGMESIEKLSRSFRDSQGNIQSNLERATGKDFNSLLKDFARAILTKDFGLNENTSYLKDVARTRLILKKGQLYLKEGDEERRLGKTCKTDWVGEWDDVEGVRGEAGVAGDNTKNSDVSPWATDYFEISVEPGSESIPAFQVTHTRGGKALLVQVLVVTHDGSEILKEMEEIPARKKGFLNLDQILEEENITFENVDKIYLLITNSDPEVPSDYKISLR